MYMERKEGRLDHFDFSVLGDEMARHKVQDFVITMMSIMTSWHLSFKSTAVKCLRKTVDSVVGDTVMT